MSRKAMLETLVKHLDMVRLSAGAAAIIAMVATGCVGSIAQPGGDDQGSNGPLTPEQAMAKDAWEHEAYPELNNSCAGCHNGNMPGAPAFLAGAGSPDEAAVLMVRDTLIAFTPAVVNLDAVASSRILTKGLHSGPALLADQNTKILDWLTKEKAAQMSTGDQPPTLETAPFSIVPCTGGNAGDPTCPINHVPLDSVGGTGAEISFVAQRLGQGIYVNELTLVGGAMGVYIEHPLFVSHPAGQDNPVPDSLDRYFDVKLDLMPGSTAQLDGGTAAFVNFDATAMISIIFRVVDHYRPDDTTPDTTGCKKLDVFKTSAQAALQSNCAAACHAGANPGAKGALDMTGMNATDDPTIQLACNQARTAINLTAPDQSGFFIEPNPGNATNHPFKFPSAAAYNTFHDTLNTWVTAEVTAQ